MFGEIEYYDEVFRSLREMLMVLRNSERNDNVATRYKGRASRGQIGQNVISSNGIRRQSMNSMSVKRNRLREVEYSHAKFEKKSIDRTSSFLHHENSQ